MWVLILLIASIIICLAGLITLAWEIKHAYIIDPKNPNF